MHTKSTTQIQASDYEPRGELILCMLTMVCASIILIMVI
jgi:hypothetical protein